MTTRTVKCWLTTWQGFTEFANGIGAYGLISETKGVYPVGTEPVYVGKGKIPLEGREFEQYEQKTCTGKEETIEVVHVDGGWLVIDVKNECESAAS